MNDHDKDIIAKTREAIAAFQKGFNKGVDEVFNDQDKCCAEKPGKLEPIFVPVELFARILDELQKAKNKVEDSSRSEILGYNKFQADNVWLEGKILLHNHLNK